jgi:hypothetical protein
MSNSTSKGLKLVYVGEFSNDPTADTVYDLAVYFNNNMNLLNAELVDLDGVQVVTTKTEESGLTQQVLYGGTY